MKKAALLAAGDSTRMLPLSANIPKHLLPVGGRPLIFQTLERLREAGIRETLIVSGYHGEDLKNAVDAQSWGSMEVSYVWQHERKGTAHAAGHAKDFAGDDPILLMYGDVMAGPDTIPQLMKYHKKGGFGLTISVYPVDNPSAFGVVKVEEGRAVGLVEKPSLDNDAGNLINAGMFCADSELWNVIDETELSPRGEYEITDSFLMLIERGNVGAFNVPTWWVDVGRPWDLLEANKLLLEEIPRRIEGEIENGATLKGNVIVENGATIRSGAYIQGPVYIGNGSVVGPNCYIRPHTYLEKNVKVGNAVEIKNCILMDGASIGHLSYVGDSIIGRKVNFGAGTITANLRHDDKSIWVTVKGKRENSGRRKLGVIIGDRVKTGIGTLLFPGVVLHTGARTGPGTIVERDIEADKLVIGMQPKRTLDMKSDE